MRKTVGALALQGAFHKHLEALANCDVNATPVRTCEDLERVDALIIPGGESTTVGILMERLNLADAIRKRAEEGMPLWGTCMGLIMMAAQVENAYEGQLSLNLLDVTVRRNAFGRQLQSFETPLSIPALGSEPFPGVFIRSPVITDSGSTEVLAKIGEDVVACRSGNLLGTCFHPELTHDLRAHRYFCEMLD